MELMEIMKARHSVRKYLDKAIQDEKRQALNKLVYKINQEQGLHLQIIYDDDACFVSLLAHYGWLKNANNYIALIGNKNDEKLEEKAGYFGEELVLKAQEIGLNTCWIGGTYKKGKTKAIINEGEKLVAIIALGYGETNGNEHPKKTIEALSDYHEGDPEWYRLGLEAARLAPTAVNQQKFRFKRDGEQVTLNAGRGTMVNIDKGIVKYHFEMISNHECL